MKKKPQKPSEYFNPSKDPNYEHFNLDGTPCVCPCHLPNDTHIRHVVACCITRKKKLS